MTDENKPWWNDGDKVGGFVATLVIGCLAIIVIWLMILAMIRLTQSVI
jgi:hypothetical protein